MSSREKIEPDAESPPRRLPKRPREALERNRLSAQRMRTLRRMRFERVSSALERLVVWRAERDPGFGTAFFMLALEQLGEAERLDRVVELVLGSPQQ